MAEVTRVVCDACGLSSSIRAGEPVVLTLDVRGHFTVTLDVHNSARCINRAVRTAVEKHFLDSNGATPA